MITNIKRIVSLYDQLVLTFQLVSIPAVLLFTRLWVAYVFFNSGLTKIASWDSTLYLFEYEYQVPLLPWQLAAYLGTATELMIFSRRDIQFLSNASCFKTVFYAGGCAIVTCR